MRMPRPTVGRLIFNLCMLAAPFIGHQLGGDTGLFIGLVVSCIGLAWFFGIFST